MNFLLVSYVEFSWANYNHLSVPQNMNINEYIHIYDNISAVIFLIIDSWLLKTELKFKRMWINRMIAYQANLILSWSLLFFIVILQVITFLRQNVLNFKFSLMNRWRNGKEEEDTDKGSKSIESCWGPCCAVGWKEVAEDLHWRWAE